MVIQKKTHKYQRMKIYIHYHYISEGKKVYAFMNNANRFINREYIDTIVCTKFFRCASVPNMGTINKQILNKAKNSKKNFPCAETF